MVRMIINKFSKITKKNILIAVMTIVAAFLIGFRVYFYIKSPNVLFLADRAGAQWIKYDSEFQPEIKPIQRIRCEFKYHFNTYESIDNAEMALQALKSARVLFDGKEIFSSDNVHAEWRKVHHIQFPFQVETGSHEIRIVVISDNSHPAVVAYSDTLPFKTGKGWLASVDGKNWLLAVPASEINLPAISKKYPSSWQALYAILPFVVVVFSLVFCIFFFTGCQDNQGNKYYNWLCQPSNIRWTMLSLWAILACNNMFKLNFQVGPDVWGHIEYIDYIAIKGSLPPFFEGWETHQGPLFYILSAPLYALLIKWFDLHSLVKMMAIIPVICGLFQIEIVYRAVKLVFAQRKDLQIIALIAGAFLPMHTYTCQYVGNEPLAGLFISLLILLCIPLLEPGQKERSTSYFILIGFVMGLALLSKLTAAPFALVMIFVFWCYTQRINKPLTDAIKPMLITFCVAALIAGWYLFRLYMEAGNFLSDKSIHPQMMQWWQDPGYRTVSQILFFGRSLVYPVYSGVASFGDTLYSTLWLDGFNSGLSDFIPWNVNIMITGALLALVPSLFIVTSAIRVFSKDETITRKSVIFSIGVIMLYYAILLDNYIVNPFYSGTKSHYTLGLLPCYAILIAAGTEPFLKNKIVRSVAMAFFACWAFAAYAAYFVV